jgi:hypothetical protein
MQATKATISHNGEKLGLRQQQNLEKLSQPRQKSVHFCTTQKGKERESERKESKKATKKKAMKSEKNKKCAHSHHFSFLL